MTRFDLDLATDFNLSVPPREQIGKLIEDAKTEGRWEVYKLLPGPFHDCNGDLEKEIDVALDIIKKEAQGYQHNCFRELMEKYGDQGLDSNVHACSLQKGGYGKDADPLQIHIMFIISNHLDGERISRVHIRKSTRYEN